MCIVFVMELHAQNIHIFRKINPEKRYMEFTYTDIRCYREATHVYFHMNEIVRIHGEYWMYTGVREQCFLKPRMPVVRFMKGRSIFKEVKIK